MKESRKVSSWEKERQKGLEDSLTAREIIVISTTPQSSHGFTTYEFSTFVHDKEILETQNKAK